MDNASSYASLRKLSVSLFEAQSIQTAKIDSRLLLEAASGLSHAQLISADYELVPEEIATRFHAFCDRRLAGEPVNRILGEREFYGRVFKLSPETLVPRDDTEILVETSLQTVRHRGGDTSILEIGTGSGIISVTLACELSHVEITATDISDEALATAHKNAEAHKVHDVIKFQKSDMFEQVDLNVDLIVSNPPYIPSEDVKKLDREVVEFDPVAALDGGIDGLDFYRTIFQKGCSFLKPEGIIIVEIGIHQANAVTELARKSGCIDVTVVKDLSGIERVVVARYQ